MNNLVKQYFRTKLALLISVLLLSLSLIAPASATLIQFNMSGTMSDSAPNANDYIPDGTMVNGSAIVDISGSGFSPILSLVSASFDWNDGTPYSVNLMDISIGGWHSNGNTFTEYRLRFSTGSFPTINGITGNFFEFFVALNHDDGDVWSDSFLNGTIANSGFSAEFQCETCINVTSQSISLAQTKQVPEPSSLALLVIGVLGIIKLRKA
ncbi:PEP-CTERM sorting domain-containing protein [uncultured Paraglaciecola sp.]|uniref:PEP-CTERM sorting domain-containing protein n=1 Tax=uncultured Paraglaciecola sp. TaxID=1765024 RepID=UPI002609D701|nr:PEP-CTERM sorting domain-containing protein [uncultured Paraglaciecola sp.]